MTAKRIIVTWTFIGASTDSKATANVPIGSTFFETDTGRSYVFDGTAWQSGMYYGVFE
jgi:hypothetical protein